MEKASNDAQIDLHAHEAKLMQEFRALEKVKMAETEKKISENNKIERDTHEIRRLYDLHKDEVIDMILDEVIGVSKNVPKVVAQRYDEEKPRQ